MAKYNVINIGGEVLNLDGAMDHADALALASEIEAEHDIDVKVVEVHDWKESDAYNTGFEACKQGEPREDNPYNKDAWNRDAWFAGWDDAN